MGVQLGGVHLGCRGALPISSSGKVRTPDAQAARPPADGTTAVHRERQKLQLPVHHAHHGRPYGTQACSSPEITARSHESRVCGWPECYSDPMMIPEPGISTASRGPGARSGTRTGENSPLRTYRGCIPGSGMYHLNACSSPPSDT